MSDTDPDPRCCLGLSPEECAWVPTNQCSGLVEEEEDDGEGPFTRSNPFGEKD